MSHHHAYLVACVLLAPVIGFEFLLGQTTGWQTYMLSNKSFSITLPELPKEKDQEIKTSAGAVKVKIYVVEPRSSGPAWFVGHSEPSSTVKLDTDERRLDRARDGAVAAMNGKLQGERRLTLQRYPGRELDIVREGDQRVRLRVYVVRQRMYTLLVVGTAEQVRSPEAERFFESFKLAE